MQTTTTDPYRMPTGLSRREQWWWREKVAEIQSHKIDAWKLERQADADQRQAQLARSDFGRLRQEYRDRHHRKPQWVADFTFKRLGIAQECVTDDGWFSRQAQEKYAGATEHYQAVQVLQQELSQFLRQRTAETLARRPVPYPREGQS